MTTVGIQQSNSAGRESYIQSPRRVSAGSSHRFHLPSSRFILLRAGLSQPTWPHVLSQARDSPPLQTMLDSWLLPAGGSLPQGAPVPVCWHSWVSLNSSSLGAVSLWLAQRALEKDVWGSPWGVLMDGST